MPTNPQPTEQKAVELRWEALLHDEAVRIADRENACSACCGAYGKDTWKDYIDDVRESFEEIGQVYLAARPLDTRVSELEAQVEALEINAKCGCAVDDPEDICVHHLGQFEQWSKKRVSALVDLVERARKIVPAAMGEPFSTWAVDADRALASFNEGGTHEN